MNTFCGKMKLNFIPGNETTYLCKYENFLLGRKTYFEKPTTALQMTAAFQLSSFKNVKRTTATNFSSSFSI
jgi:hypothetical protein